MTIAEPETATLLELPLLTHRGTHTTRAHQTVHGVDGAPLASLSLAPDLLLGQALAAQRRAAPLPAPERAARLAEAADRFLDDTLGGLTFRDHLALVRRVSGHNAPLTEELSRAVATAVAAAPARADRARPVGSLGSWRQAAAGPGSGVWTRRGETLAAVLSGNTPTIQNGWLQALALGYRVAVRPSRREPFTAHRVVAALRAAGFQPTDAVCLPTGHAGAETLLRRADLGLVWGGDDVLARYGAEPTIRVGGPGRAKTLVTRGHHTPRTVASIAEAVTALSGAACVNTSAVLVEGDHAALAAELAAALTEAAAGRQTTDRHLGPRVAEATAEALLGQLRRAGAHFEIPLDRIATPHPEGGVVLGPAVLTVADAHHPLVGGELPFPCVTVAPWAPADGIAPLRGSLVVTAHTEDDALVEALLHEPTVGNVHLGAPTSHGGPELPHEGYPGTFLMRDKAVVAAR
ncbi:aldehyde dehydrogenase family protein [Streptomyces sp. 3MP-14]|uniref:Aldehyde dehydrogenase family protein n=1 Tax=Streptomyces mimosae TaxID=2586635 RepID=A0A5N6A281_9ACTN|nr:MULTISPECIES: aldehyde dehydrogenase family protein [Streptomyces]KAB8162877.1 aldehyde dehydrogenase family protein [Streptomyces mimosae]KAB8179090.1 aldehyde dehydrogenase family protein [Streptomyces sp. 3MP-14]